MDEEMYCMACRISDSYYNIRTKNKVEAWNMKSKNETCTRRIQNVEMSNNKKENRRTKNMWIKTQE